MDEVIDSGVLKPLLSQNTEFHHLSLSRLGYSGNPEIAEQLFRKLREMGFARESEDGSSIPMHPMVRYLVLVLLAQMLREPGRKKGLDLAPITDRYSVMRSLSEILNLRDNTSNGRVVEFDLQAVVPDLSTVPLDEVLDFRREHCDEHRRYMRGLRSFAREISLMPLHEQDRAITDRREELDQYASEIQNACRTEWRKPVTIGLGLAGAAWLATDDPLSALFGLAMTTLGVMDGQRAELDAFSYLMSAKERFS